MKKSNIKFKIIRSLSLTISIFYFVFLFMDIFNLNSFISSKALKFASMILIFIICAITGKDALSRRNHFLLISGLFFTLLADMLLLVVNSYYILGIGLFSLVQIIYFVRYSGKDFKFIFLKFMLLFSMFLIIYFIIDSFMIEINFLTVISLFYAICILSSTYMALRVYRYNLWPKLNSQVISIAMILFLFCDINVALYNILSSIDISGYFIPLKNISFISIWFFYLPSQVLLALSGYREEYLKYLFKI